MPPKASEFDHDMAALESDMKRLEAEYNMFFAGRLPRLPWETRARVDALVKRYDRAAIGNTAQRFRFATLQARYAAFCDLWERALRAKEEGRPGGRTRAARPAAAAPPAPASADKVPDVVAVAVLRDPGHDVERVRELYDRLSAARQAAGEPPIAFDRFAQVVRAQVTKLGGGSTEVAFRVAVQDGKVTLTARVLKGG